ncbi:MAG: BlaI/MecI/CopY family transcriptional regulator [candidate division WOR-3 bacterium]
MKLSKSLKLFLGELQAECLDILWDLNKATCLDILEVFKKRGKNYAYTTILTEMQNLEKKGIVKSEKIGKKNLYFPVISKEEFLKKKTEEILSPLLEEVPHLVAMNFIKKTKLNEKEKRKLIEILNLKE